MSDGPPGGWLLDLFGTLVLVDERRVPEMSIDGRVRRTTLPLLLPLLAAEAPGATPAGFVEALRRVTDELVAARCDDHRERPSRRRFAEALRRAGCDAGRVESAAIALSRRHLAAIADATTFPASHAATLRALAARGRVAVVSNFDDTGTAFAILQRHGILPHVASVVISEGVGLRKPRPELVVQALRELDVAPDAAAFVGDTWHEDVAAAHAAGVRCVWIDARAAGVPPGAAPPWRVVRAFPDVASIASEAP